MSTRLNRGIVSLGVLGIGAGTLLAVAGAAAPAMAFTGSCPTTTPTATLVANNVCEVRFTTSGDHTFAVPSGITKLSAVLVGGGGAGGHFTSGGEFPTTTEYAGGGGDVQYIDSVAITHTLAVHVGKGGFAEGGDGEDTTVAASVAKGGIAGSDDFSAGSTQGQSGSGKTPDFCNDNDNLSIGGGAKTNATGGETVCVPGVGFVLAELSGLSASTDWPAGSFETTAYGNGGSVDGGPVGSTTRGSGGSVVSSQGDGGLVVQGQAGSDGLVILRFVPAPPKPELAATGTTIAPAVPALAAFALAGGAVLLGLARRRSRRA
jgi:hypothetical protein